LISWVASPYHKRTWGVIKLLQGAHEYHTLLIVREHANQIC
jgi:hypothetical protein